MFNTLSAPKGLKLEVRHIPLRIKIQILYFTFSIVTEHFGCWGMRYSSSRTNSTNFDILDVIYHPAQISRDNPRGFSKSDQDLSNIGHRCHVSEICMHMAKWSWFYVSLKFSSPKPYPHATFEIYDPDSRRL